MQQLTKREIFAAFATAGILANPNNGSAECKDISGWAVEQADSLIEELKIQPSIWDQGKEI